MKEFFKFRRNIFMNRICNFIVLFKGIFFPYLLVGLCGWGLILLKLRKSGKKTTFAIFFCIFFMLLWRSLLKSFSSSRYIDNLYFFFAFGGAYFLLHWDMLFRKNPYKKETVILKGLIILLALCLLAWKFFHYNPYCNYNSDISECINHDSCGSKSIIVSVREKFPNLGTVSQVNLPDFLVVDKKKEDYLLRAIRQYQFSMDSFYISTDLPLEDSNIPDDDAQNLSLLGRFQKNRKGKKEYVYRYDGSPMAEKMSMRQDLQPSNKTNLIKNGGFEKQRAIGKKSYYELIATNKSDDIIPEGHLFPEGWDIFWGRGFTEDNQVIIYSDESRPIDGKYSLYIKCDKSVAFLCSTYFPAKRYLFQCDIRPLQRSIFGLQLSLRDKNNTFYGFRKIKEISMDRMDTIYHYEIELSKDMIYPFERFYLYLSLYDQGEIEIDNVSLSEME